MKNRIILAVALSIGLAASASAQILMTNPGFEEPNVAPDGWGRWSTVSPSVGPFPGWTLIPGADSSRTFVYGEDQVNMLKSPTSGDQSLGLSASSTLTQGLYQSLGTLQANTDYSFSYEIGFRPTNNASMTYRIGLWGDTTGDGNPDTPLDYRTQADDTPPSGPVGGNLKVISSDTVNSSTFDSDAIGNQFFFYFDTIATDAGEELLVDNVGVIPEPSVALLLGAAGMFHFILRRRRR
jgi:hypothetical protein